MCLQLHTHYLSYYFLCSIVKNEKRRTSDVHRKFSPSRIELEGRGVLKPKRGKKKKGSNISFISQVVFGSGEFFNVRIKQKRCFHVERSSQAE